MGGSFRRQIINKYGSRRGFVRTYWHALQYYLGRYRAYRGIDWNAVERLVFVCKGNICRSAYAEAVARSLGIDAVSCGLKTVLGAPANEQARLAARRKGHDLEDHKTTPIMYMILKKSDLLIAMEPWQAESLGEHLIRSHYRTLLGVWSKPVRPHIQDPYGLSKNYFEECFTYIEQSVHEIAKQIKRAKI